MHQVVTLPPLLHNICPVTGKKEGSQKKKEGSEQRDLFAAMLNFVMLKCHAT